MTEDRYVEVPAELTQQTRSAQLPDDFVTMPSGQAAHVLGEAYSIEHESNGQCNDQLAAIARLGKDSEGAGAPADE